MAKTASQMLPLGTALPQFTLPDTIASTHFNSAELMGKNAVVAFWCNHCPYVIHIRDAFLEFAREAQTKGVGVVAISSNDAVGYPQDAPEKMTKEAHQYHYPMPYLYDASQSVAKQFLAACTPDFYLFNSEGRLAYRGQFDSSRPKNSQPTTGADLRAALSALLASTEPNAEQIPSVGCNIKWKADTAPSYFDS